VCFALIAVSLILIATFIIAKSRPLQCRGACLYGRVPCELLSRDLCIFFLWLHRRLIRLIKLTLSMSIERRRISAAMAHDAMLVLVLVASPPLQHVLKASLAPANPALVTPHVPWTEPAYGSAIIGSADMCFNCMLGDWLPANLSILR